MTIQLLDLIPGAMNCMKNVAKIRPGQEVLIIADTSTDRDVADAYKIAAKYSDPDYLLTEKWIPDMPPRD